MNKLVLDLLMDKSDEQLIKELVRRGFKPDKYRYLPKALKVQSIIEHDAYYEGVNDARRGTLRNGKIFEPCVVYKEPAPKPPKRNRCFLTAEDDEYPTVLNLTQDQINLMQYLLDRGFLGDASFVPTQEGMEVDAP